MTDSADDRLQQRLRRLRIAEPDRALRERTLRAVRAELSRRVETAGWRLWLARWRTEVIMAAAVVVCLAVLPALRYPVPALRPAPEREAREEAARLAEGLGINGALRPYLESRLALVKSGGEKGRYGYHESRRTLEEQLF